MSFVLGLGSIRLLDAMVCGALDAELPLHCEAFFRVGLSLLDAAAQLGGFQLAIFTSRDPYSL